MVGAHRYLGIFYFIDMIGFPDLKCVYETVFSFITASNVIGNNEKYIMLENVCNNIKLKNIVTKCAL